MYDDSKIYELKKKVNDLREQKRNISKEVDQKLTDALTALYKEERLKEDYIIRQKAKSKPSYMNIIFKWDNGIEFDTRKKYMNQFKDYVFSYGLPTSFEVRG